MNSIINNLINRIDQRFRAPLPLSAYNQAIPLENTLSLIFPELPTNLETLKLETDFVLSALNNDIEFPSTSDVTLICHMFAIVRLLRPLHIVETGVWIGSSSFTILSALKRNGDHASQLHSIDLPPVRFENRVEVGRVVPGELRENWNLHLGASTEILPGLLASIPFLDLFIHDSDHTYRNITFELRTAWNALRPGGIIIVDDAHTNHAAIDFAAAVDCEPVLVKRQKGGCIAIIRK